MPVIIDSHCHIDFNDFDVDRDDVIQRAQQLGVEKIIVPGVQRTSWDRVRHCCDTYSALYPCYGLHPYFIAEHNSDDIQALASYIEQHRPVAVGECGLDFFLKELDRDQQQFYFEQQLDIALQADLPVVIHARKSTEAVIDAIRQRPGIRGMIHSYSGSYEQAVKLIDLGFISASAGQSHFNRQAVCARRSLNFHWIPYWLKPMHRINRDRWRTGNATNPLLLLKWWNRSRNYSTPMPTA